MLVPTARTSPVLYLQVRHWEEEIHIMLENLLKELLPVPQLQLLLLHLLCIQVPLGLLHVSWGEKEESWSRQGCLSPSACPSSHCMAVLHGWWFPSALLYQHALV